MLYHVLIFLALIAFGRGAGVALQRRVQAEEDVPLFKVISNYRGCIAGSKEALASYGQRTALVLDDEMDPKKYDREIMKAILKMLDNTLGTHDRARKTGSWLGSTVPRNASSALPHDYMCSEP